jgi:hypothetical protein
VETLAAQGGLFLAACAVSAGVLARRGRLSPRQREAVRLGLWAAAAFGAFFVINNTRNGFVFAGLLWLAPALAIMVARMDPGGFAGAALAAALIFLSGVQSFSFANEPFLAEARFLSEQVGKRGVLLVPGCPYPELSYLSGLSILALWDASIPSPQRCPSPGAPLDAGLVGRLREPSDPGAPVLLALGSNVSVFDADVSEAIKWRQIFSPWRAAGADQARLEASMLAKLPKIKGIAVSPNGWRYARLDQL